MVLVHSIDLPRRLGDIGLDDGPEHVAKVLALHDALPWKELALTFALVNRLHERDKEPEEIISGLIHGEEDLDRDEAEAVLSYVGYTSTEFDRAWENHGVDCWVERNPCKAVI